MLDREVDRIVSARYIPAPRSRTFQLETILERAVEIDAVSTEPVSA